MTDREQALVEAVRDALSCLGSPSGYFPDIGAPKTRKLQAAIAAYEVPVGTDVGGDTPAEINARCKARFEEAGKRLYGTGFTARHPRIFG